MSLFFFCFFADVNPFFLMGCNYVQMLEGLVGENRRKMKKRLRKKQKTRAKAPDTATAPDPDVGTDTSYPIPVLIKCIVFLMT